MAWIMQNGRPFESNSIKDPSTPFIGNSPFIFWRIDPNANEGRPYQGLMIGVPILATETAPPAYYDENRVPAMYYGDIPIYDAYYGNTKIET